jgi:CheY-like chemotaxis protein
MPGMNGIELMKHVRAHAPDSVRVLQSGQADLGIAIRAINEGQLFRFLLKPVQPADLLTVVASAVEQHRLVAAERELLEKTVTASIGAMVDLLAITQPTSFGRASRLKQYCEAVAKERGLRHHWALGVAALLSQVGFIIVPAETASRAHRGERLTAEERALLGKLLPFAEQLVGAIPRLEPVCAILRMQYMPDAGQWAGDEECEQSASILRTVIAFDGLERAGVESLAAIEKLEAMDTHDASSLNALRRMFRGVIEPESSGVATTPSVRAVNVSRPTPSHAEDSNHLGIVGSEEVVVPLAAVEVGMAFAADVVAANGVLLVARGQTATASLVQRIENYWSDFAGELNVRILRSSVPESVGAAGQ